MTTITKERLLKIKQWRETYVPSYNVILPAWEAAELARIALSSMESEPVAMLADKSPVNPDDFALVPKKLTAENGAKGVLFGEFSETKFINCPECFGDDECETCDGSGIIEITVPVTWTTIKAIWAKGVEHFASAPQQEAKHP
ncbi:hypothetical protein [Edwardsiella tarda]|uniref:hypothetical protein n=1 Tax=Edwardsiella tarda TaxID=636 RepID=UPI003081FAAD|nr:hypothetical protein GBS0709_24820 [Edwardsiella tarda]